MVTKSVGLRPGTSDRAPVKPGQVAARTGWPRLARALAISAFLVIVTTETSLRLIHHHTSRLGALLYSPGDPVSYDHLHGVRELIEATPFHPQPFQDWAGFKLNSLGLRTHEYSRVKPPDVYRLLALGDSFTFDSGLVPLHEMWHSLVGERIRERTRRAVEVINLGVPGVGPRFALRLFEIEGRYLSPDLVLFGLFVGNDLRDELGLPGSGLERWSLTWRLVRHLVVLARHGSRAAAQAGKQKIEPTNKRWAGPGGFSTKDYVYDPEVSFTDEAAFLAIERNAARIFDTRFQPEVERSIDEVVDTVRRLGRAVQQAGASLVVILIPDQVQVDESFRRAVVESSGIPANAYDFDWVQAALSRRFADAEVTAVDLLPAFRSAAVSPRLYRRRNTHWSAAGNGLAAARIADFLKDLPSRE